MDPYPSRALQFEQNESGFQAALESEAALCGWKLRYHTHDSRRSADGFPDLVLVRGPELVIAELKRAGQRPSAAQERWLDGLSRVQRVYVRLWTPQDWPEIDRLLARRD